MSNPDNPLNMPWSFLHQDNYWNIEDKDDDQIFFASLYDEENRTVEHIVKCLELLNGVHPDNFPMIHDWLCERGLKPMEG